jgi:hypothetical protein
VVTATLLPWGPDAEAPRQTFGKCGVWDASPVPGLPPSAAAMHTRHAKPPVVRVVSRRIPYHERCRRAASPVVPGRGRQAMTAYKRELEFPPSNPAARTPATVCLVSSAAIATTAKPPCPLVSAAIKPHRCLP